MHSPPDLYAVGNNGDLFFPKLVAFIMITVGLVDANNTIRNRISKILAWEDLAILFKLSNGLELLKYLHTQKTLPDVLLVDINITRIDGVTLTDYLTDHFPAIKVIGISSYVETEIIEDMLECGAWGYVSKQNLEQLPAAIQTICCNEVYIDTLFDFRGRRRVELIARRTENKAIKKNLGITKREATFILLTATDLEYNEIAALMFVERKTLDRFFSNISKKIEVKNRHHLTLFSLRHGLVKIARLRGLGDGKAV